MRFLVTEKLGPHKFKTPEGYLICTDVASFLATHVKTPTKL